MAFVLGLETDSINDWVHDADLPYGPDRGPPRHPRLLRVPKDLGVVQVNLIHLTDNAFGGMALYNRLFMINSFTRRGVLPDTENGWTAHAKVEEKISAPVDIATVPWEHLEPELTKLGISPADASASGTWGQGDRNQHGLTRRARSPSTRRCGSGWWWTWTTCPRGASTRRPRDRDRPRTAGLPAVSAHNGARSWRRARRR